MQLETIRAQIMDAKGIRWHYRAHLVSLYHHIKQVQFGQGQSGAPKFKRGWSMRDTAKELGLSVGSIHGYLKLEAAVSKDPALKELSLKQALAKVR